MFTNYYNKLVNILPASSLSHYFVSDKTISTADHEDIIRSSVPREAAKLLLDKVLWQLKKGNSRVFNNLLLIMDHHGVAAAKDLSSEMRDKVLKIKSDDSVISDFGKGNNVVWIFNKSFN